MVARHCRRAWPYRADAGSLERDLDHAIDPGGERVAKIAANLRIPPTGPRRHVKGMIGVRKKLQRGAVAERLAAALQARRAPPACRGCLAGTTSGSGRRRDARRDRATACRPDGAENRGTPVRARRAAVHAPGPATSSGRRRICRRRSAAAWARRAPPRRPRRARRLAQAAADRGAWRRAPYRETGSAGWRCRARQSSAATAAMNGCFMPAPAPCAST